MSSSSKTENLRLNNWSGSDIPKREDFNMDNSIIDSVLGSHIEDTAVHITNEERTKWNSHYYIGTYVGNNSSSRNITLGCSFEPSWGIVFAVGTMPSINDYTNRANYNYFGIVSLNGSTIGLSLSGRQLTAVQSTTAVSGTEYRNFNEGGNTYVYIVFR